MKILIERMKEVKIVGGRERGWKRDRERNIERESESLRFFIFIESFYFQARQIAPPKKKNEKDKNTWMVTWKKKKLDYTNL